MNDFSAFLSVSCRSQASKPRPVYIEPWGEDYWLFPGDDIDIVAFSRETTATFGVVESDGDTQIYLEQCHDVKVFCDGQQIVSGFQRSQLIGKADHAFTIIGRGVVITSDKPWQRNLKVGNDLRIIIPQANAISAKVLALEHLNTGSNTALENPWGLFLGEIGVDAKKIPAGASVYCLESLSP
jgi:hypothetical protein